MPRAARRGGRCRDHDGRGPRGAQTSSRQFRRHLTSISAQCGFCTSGIMMAGHGTDRPDAEGGSRRKILEALSGHRCRCTGYIKIVSAVEAAATGEVHPGSVEPSSLPGMRGHRDSREPGMKAVGARLPRYDGIAHVTAPDDICGRRSCSRTLWVKALRSPHDHAAILSIDTAAAEAMPGVHGPSPERTCPRTCTAISRRSASPPTSRCSPKATSATRASRGGRGRGDRGPGRRRGAGD